MTTDKPKDFIKFVCMRCSKEEDYFYEGCTCYATRDHAPTICPTGVDHVPQWEIGEVLWREGKGTDIEYLRKKANAGDPVACLYLGKLGWSK